MIFFLRQVGVICDLALWEFISDGVSYSICI